MSFKFLLQATRILHSDNFDEKELKMVYNYATNVDNETLIFYYENSTILGFENDLDLFEEIVSELIKIFENNEEYEKCYVLKKKKDECEEIINSLKIN